MSNATGHHPLTLGLFEKRIEGDDALLELARLRFQETGLGAEMHAATPEELEKLLAFRVTPETPVTVHLPRDLDLLNESGRQRILDFAARFAGRVYGLVIHDRLEMANHPAAFLAAAVDLNSRLEKIERSPFLFIEYAVGLEPDLFVILLAQIRELRRVSVCIDTGHVGIWQARHAYMRNHSGADICSLRPPHPRLPALIGDVEAAVSTALPAELALTQAVGRFGKPVHFHLHDGHPLSKFSLFGVSDHLSFLQEIPLNFEHHGRRSVPPMFGPGGLAQIVAQAIEVVGRERLSFTLEIHPINEQLALGAVEPLFAHWQDKTNAEKMNHWLSVLSANHRLLRECLNPPLPSAASAAVAELDLAAAIS